MRKRKREPRKRQDQGTEIAAYYGCRHDHGITSCVSAEELDGCKHVIGELPPHPQLMSFVDLQLWVFKLFRLHPETQDLSIRGFLKQYTLDLFDYMEHAPEWYLEYAEWENKRFMTDKCWRSFAKKIKSKGNVVQKFMLYVSSSEIKHYDALLKAANDGYSQLPPIVLAGKESLSRYNRIERQFGTFYDSYDYAPRFLRGRGPGAFVDIEGTEVQGCKDFRSPFEVKEFRVLRRIFWAFHQCIYSFKYCRPVLCIKGVPLSGKYKGVLLTAVAIDANESALPVAYAVVEGETKQSWLWFLRNVKRGVVKERSGVCIIHDYKRELTSAIHDIKNNQQEPHPWRDVQSTWCVEHIAENFLAVFADEELMMMFKRCQQKRESKFVDIWKELDKLTLKYMAEKEGHANAEPRQESVGHGGTELNPHRQCDSAEDDEGEGGDNDGSNNKIMKFSDWVRWKPMEKWSLLHDTNGARYGIMDSNVADVYNHVLKVIKCFPLAGIAELTFHCTAQYFKKTSAADDPPMKYPVHVQDDLNSELQKSKMYEVICMNAEDTNVYIGDCKVQWGQKSVIVHLNTSCTRGSMSKSKRFIIIKSAQCSCNKPQLLHKPCSHVIAVCRFIGVPAATYISPYYSLSYLAKTLSGEVEPYKTTEGDINITPSLPTTWIPNKKLECYLPVSLTAGRTETAIDEYEWQCVSEAHSKAHFREFLFY